VTIHNDKQTKERQRDSISATVGMLG